MIIKKLLMKMQMNLLLINQIQRFIQLEIKKKKRQHIQIYQYIFCRVKYEKHVHNSLLLLHIGFLPLYIFTYSSIQGIDHDGFVVDYHEADYAQIATAGLFLSSFQFLSYIRTYVFHYQCILFTRCLRQRQCRQSNHCIAHWSTMSNN